MVDEDGKDPYKVAKEKGIFKVVSSGSLLTTRDIVERIIKNRFVLFSNPSSLPQGPVKLS